MLNQEWSKLPLSRQQLGAFGEHYARALLTLHGLRTYTPDIDDHGIDLLAEGSAQLFKLQIKTVRLNTGYVYMKERDFPIHDPAFYLLLIVLVDGREPYVYLIPASAWTRGDKPCLVHHNYQIPEYGVNISLRNLPQLEVYQFPGEASIIPEPLNP